jgi:hypothetical protein
MLKLRFIDVSYYDQIVDWASYTWEGAFIKASEGTVEDKTFQEQWAAARGYIIRSAYHFFRPRIDPVKAAERFVEILGKDGGELPGALDLEDTDDMPDTGDRAIKWLNRYTSLTGRRAIVYTSPGFINQAKLVEYPVLAKYPLWCATYPYDKIFGTWTEAKRHNKIFEVLNDPSKLAPIATPRPWNSIEWIQWTGKCPPEYVPGYPLGEKMAVDINFYNGTLKQLIDKYGIVMPKKGEPMADEPVTMIANLLPGSESNLRSGPGLDHAIRKTLEGPLTLECVGNKIFEDGYYWIEVIRPEQGFIALTKSYTVKDPNDEDESPSPVPTPNPSKKVTKSVLYYSDGSTEELVPKS